MEYSHLRVKMTERIFIKKMNVLFQKLLGDYYNGEEIEGNVKAVELLCHNYLEMKEMEKKNIEGNKI